MIGIASMTLSAPACPKKHAPTDDQAFAVFSLNRICGIAVASGSRRVKMLSALACRSAVPLATSIPTASAIGIPRYMVVSTIADPNCSMSVLVAGSISSSIRAPSMSDARQNAVTPIVTIPVMSAGHVHSAGAIRDGS